MEVRRCSCSTLGCNPSLLLSVRQARTLAKPHWVGRQSLGQSLPWSRLWREK